MAKPVARKSGAHKTESTAISFSKDQDTGLYKKIEQKIRYSHLDHITKKIGKPIVHENLYMISDENDFDHSFTVSSPKGDPVVIYLKEVRE